MQVDPHLSRTVVVSTKLDTRLPQFARGHDVELFLRPPGRLLEPGMLGGCPFFTCAALCLSSTATQIVRNLTWPLHVLVCGALWAVDQACQA